MKTFIEKTINPPGIAKPNRRSLFSTIGEVADKMKNDALKAFNAHFPYLADSAKLEEHGLALLIPRLLDDTEKEYRDRVATASFFLMRAGERAYIIEQLNAHFGGRYIVSDEFLEVYVKVQDLAENDRHWLLQFLDELINPNVKLSVAEWFHIIEKIIETDQVKLKSNMALRDTLNCGAAKLNGRIKLDGATIGGTEKVRPALSGRWKLNGVLDLSAAYLEFPAVDFLRVPVRLGKGILEALSIDIKTSAQDIFKARVKLNGAIKMNAAERLSGFGRVNDRLRCGIKYHIKLSGQYPLNGYNKLNSGLLLAA
jgi:hypothetical protein